MARITAEGIEACIAFGEASIAVHEIVELARSGRQSFSATAFELFVEIESAHDRLRGLFDRGHNDEVCGLALSMLVLAQRIQLTLE